MIGVFVQGELPVQPENLPDTAPHRPDGLEPAKYSDDVVTTSLHRRRSRRRVAASRLFRVQIVHVTGREWGRALVCLFGEREEESWKILLKNEDVT